MTDHHQPAEEAQVYFPLSLAAYLQDGDLEADQDHDERLTRDEVAFLHASAVLDAIVDGRPWTLQDDLALMLAGPFGVDWRTGQHPVEAPPTSWEPIVLELGHQVVEALHLDPIWDDDPTDDA